LLNIGQPFSGHQDLRFAVSTRIKPELGQRSAHLSADGAIEGVVQAVVQDDQVPDLHRSKPA